MQVRNATARDVAEMAAILNAYVVAGGVTAVEAPLSEAKAREWYLTGEHSLCCVVAEDRDGKMLGFQALDLSQPLPDGWADIATFARTFPRPSGVGTALFAATLERARRAGLHAINATIRADNAAGLAYYARLGFETYDVWRGVPLRDGTPADRIFKRFTL